MRNYETFPEMNNQASKSQNAKSHRNAKLHLSVILTVQHRVELRQTSWGTGKIWVTLHRFYVSFVLG